MGWIWGCRGWGGSGCPMPCSRIGWIQGEADVAPSSLLQVWVEPGPRSLLHTEWDRGRRPALYGRGGSRAQVSTLWQRRMQGSNSYSGQELIQELSRAPGARALCGCRTLRLDGAAARSRLRGVRGTWFTLWILIAFASRRSGSQKLGVTDSVQMQFALKIWFSAQHRICIVTMTSLDFTQLSPNTHTYTHAHTHTKPSAHSTRNESQISHFFLHYSREAEGITSSQSRLLLPFCLRRCCVGSGQSMQKIL